jgi:hypothetical protein
MTLCVMLLTDVAADCNRLAVKQSLMFPGCDSTAGAVG